MNLECHGDVCQIKNILLQIPRFFAYQVHPSACDLGDVDCVCDHNDDNNSTVDCSLYTFDPLIYLTESALAWRIYLILSELALHVVPAIIFAVLSVLMIKDFNNSVRRRRQLIASAFAVSSSVLISPGPAKLMLDEDEKEEIRRHLKPRQPQGQRTGGRRNLPDVILVTPDERESSLFRVAEQRHSSSFALPDKKIKKLAEKIESNRDRVKKTLKPASNQDKTEIATVTFIGLIFILCYSPTVLYRIIGALTWPDLHANSGFQVFSVVADLTAVVGVSVHFYVYLFADPRYLNAGKHFAGKGLLKRRKRRYSTEDDEDDEEQEELQEESRALIELFPTIFGEKNKNKNERVEDDGRREQQQQQPIWQQQQQRLEQRF